MELDNRTRAELGSFAYSICRKLKLGQWRKLHFVVGFYLEVALKCLHGRYKVVFYDISSIMWVDRCTSDDCSSQREAAYQQVQFLRGV